MPNGQTVNQDNIYVMANNPQRTWVRDKWEEHNMWVGLQATIHSPTSF